MADEREYWLPPYWEASELFLAMIIKIIIIILLITNKQTNRWKQECKTENSHLDREGVVRREEWYGEEKPEKGPCRD